LHLSVILQQTYKPGIRTTSIELTQTRSIWWDPPPEPEKTEPEPGAEDAPSPSEKEESSAAPGENAADESSSAAYNPETGEINWDCPCLGGMAHGPCGQQFREAFSCFVFSEQEPKGVDCIQKFKAMQDCFREHPDVYGEGQSFYELNQAVLMFSHLYFVPRRAGG
jgi:hypothetical protein